MSGAVAVAAVPLRSLLIGDRFKTLHTNREGRVEYTDGVHARVIFEDRSHTGRQLRTGERRTLHGAVLVVPL